MFEGLLREVNMEVILKTYLQPYVPSCPDCSTEILVSKSEHTRNSVQSQGLGCYGLENQVFDDGSG